MEHHRRHAVVAGSGQLLAQPVAGIGLRHRQVGGTGDRDRVIEPLEPFELASAAIFDLGVFLCVLGAVLLALASLSRLALRTGETANTRPFDIDPSGGGR